jgi:protein TonB
MFNDVTITGNDFLALVALLVVITLGIIFYFRYRYKKLSADRLTEKYQDHNWNSPLAGRSKYPEADAFKMRKSIFRYGLASSLALVFFAISWTTVDDAVYIPTGTLEIENLEIIPPRTPPPSPPPPPPPPPPPIDPIPTEEIVDEQPDFVDTSVEVDEAVEDAPVAEIVDEVAPPPPPPPPLPIIEEAEKVFKVVEQMPRFPGCESLGTKEEKKQCADGKLLQYIYKNLRYPSIAIENGVEGTAVIKFVVDKDGSVTNVELVRDPGAGTGAAAQKVVVKMNDLPQKWTPGKQRGRAVSVWYTLPVKFKLEG